MPPLRPRDTIATGTKSIAGAAGGGSQPKLGGWGQKRLSDDTFSRTGATHTMMARSLFVVALLLVIGCRDQAATPAQAPRRPELDNFFSEWLKAHGHSDVVIDDGGVGIAGNETRLMASLYGSNKHDDGSYVVEVEFTTRLPSHGQITDFVAGMGNTEATAINDALLNFTLTTFHVIYKGFINAEDPHISATTVKINGADRAVIAGDIMLRGGPKEGKLDLEPLRAEILKALKQTSLSPLPHWVKIVYSQQGGKPMTVAVTLDNTDELKLTEEVKRLKWPP
jgi:hypothetical protein